MRIALLDNQIILDGAQRFLVDLARGLCLRKWEVTAIVGAEGPLVGSFAAVNIPVVLLALPAPLCQARPAARVPDTWRVVTQLSDILRRQHIDILYANSPITAFWGGIAAKLAGVRLIWRVHLAEELTYSRLHSSLALRLAAQIHLATDTMRHSIPHVGNMARVLPLAIDLERYAAKAPAARKGREQPLIGMIDYWHPHAGQEVLLRAVRLLQESGRHTRICLVGETQSAEEERYRSVVLSAVKAAGLGERVKTHERVDDLAVFLADCDIVVIPALSETSGRLALEAAAIGRPVIASRVDGLSGIIEDGHTGLLVPPNQPQALADALALLLASPALCIQMGRKARVRCEEHFTMTATLNVLEQLMQKRR